MRSTLWYIKIGSLTPASCGGRALAQVPEVDVLEKPGIGRERGCDQPDAAVEEAAVHDVLAHEAPQRAGHQVQERGPAAARVQVLRSPARVDDDLLKLVRQVAVGEMADRAAQRAGLGDRLEAF